jgi:hypothetical protein
VKVLRSIAAVVTINPLSLLAVVVPSFPMLYFLLTTPSFFFHKFSDPPVVWMMRGLFNVYFLTVAACFSFSALVFAISGRYVISGALCTLSILALVARRYFLAEVDGQSPASTTSRSGAASRLRCLHVGGMAYNACQIALFITLLPKDLAMPV